MTSTPTAPSSPLLPESDRPHVVVSDERPVTAVGELSASTLLQVHDHLRQELADILRAMDAVGSGRLDVEAARSFINRTAIRQNAWNLGAFCAQYCRVVALHHTIEDRHVFPALSHESEALGDVLNRLAEEHEIIAEVLERFDRALVALVEEPSNVAGVKSLAGELSDALLSHLAYEEHELVGALSRSSLAI